MTRSVVVVFLVLSFAGTAFDADTAEAAPVARPVELELSIEMVGLKMLPGGCYSCAFVYGPIAAGVGTVTVDETAGTIGLAAGLATLATPFVGIDYGVSTAIAGVTASQLSNWAGTFSVGGGQGLPGEPPCPAGPLTFGVACAGQQGFGGFLGLAGTVNLQVVPNVITIPFDLAALNVGLGGTGPVTSGGFGYDAAPWTVGTARVALAGFSAVSPIIRTGSVGTQQFSLVTPSRVTALGNILPIVARLEVRFTDGLGVPTFVSAVPEPSLGWLALLAGLAVVAARRRR